LKEPNTIAILIYGSKNSGRDALSEEKYRELALAFLSQGYLVKSVLYSDEQAAALSETLAAFDAILVWINPIEQGNDRKKLDELLVEIASKGCFVSTHPEVILKMGTKDILFKTRNMDWSSDVKMYTSFEQFQEVFPASLRASQVRVLKQYRGNGGNGVFKITLQADEKLSLTHAIAGNEAKVLAMDELVEEFKPFFLNGGLLIDQEWNKNINNGMVRCYVSGTRVAGFGYQEINALYEIDDKGVASFIPPGKRYYFTENCGLFSDLKKIMEGRWIPELQTLLDIPDNKMPVIWDADFFINSISSSSPIGKYTLCEINVSCVSPFPPSAISYMVADVANRIAGKDTP
jgi:hypothetical protein